jgi:hypothetical protein
MIQKATLPETIQSLCDHYILCPPVIMKKQSSGASEFILLHTRAAYILWFGSRIFTRVQDRV